MIITDQLSMFSVTFQPNGLSHFLKMPINELQNQTVSIANIDNLFSPQLEEQLAQAPGFQKRIVITEHFFLSLLKNQTFTVDHERMIKAIRLIRTSKGNIGIDFLAANACLSRKQFERKFSAYIGISPKQFLKIIRFQNTLFLKQNATTTHLTDLAYQAGYYDQSHFNNEIKELTGQTPGKLFENEDIISDFFC